MSKGKITKYHQNKLCCFLTFINHFSLYFSTIKRCCITSKCLHGWHWWSLLR